MKHVILVVLAALILIPMFLLGYSQEQQEQLGYLKEGPLKWNEWRRDKRPKNIDFNLCNFSNASFNSINLNSVSLKAAIFYKADLSYAKLREANLEAADLQYANVYNADLFSANLLGANMMGANLSRQPRRNRYDLCAIERV